jgi:hypothetical protein
MHMHAYIQTQMHAHTQTGPQTYRQLHTCTHVHMYACNCYIYRHRRAEEGHLENGLFHYLTLNPKPDTRPVIHIINSYRHEKGQKKVISSMDFSTA